MQFFHHEHVDQLVLHVDSRVFQQEQYVLLVQQASVLPFHHCQPRQFFHQLLVKLHKRLDVLQMLHNEVVSNQSYLYVVHQVLQKKKKINYFIQYKYNKLNMFYIFTSIKKLLNNISSSLCSSNTQNGTSFIINTVNITSPKQ